MSRAFVKEDDQEEAPLIPPRAALPAGETNYVTPAGYDALLNERASLEEEKRLLPKDNETEHRRSVMLLDGKLKLLNERINSAQVLRPEEVSRSEVRFGAVVTLKNGKEQQRFQIVGVDEADPRQEKIAFTAPIARVLMGKKQGETAELRMRGKTQKLEVVEIGYG